MSDVGLACNKVAGCVGAVNAIPDGWSLDKLENFVTNKILGTTSRGTGLSNVLLLKMGNLKGGRINYDKVEYVENKEELQSLTLEYGDFLFNTRNTPELVGKVSNFCEKRLKAVYDNNLLRLKFNDYIDPIYMGYLFNLGSTVQQLKQIVAGTTSVAAIYWKDLALLKQIVPPLPEQQKIAQILTSVDEVIEKTQAQIDKLKDLKTAMMQELLTKGIGHVEFKDTPVGRIPVGWGLTTLGEIGKWKGGGTPSKANESYWRGQIPWVSPKDVKVEYISKTKDSISMEAILGSSTNLVEKGSLLIVVRSGILQHTLPIAIANCDLTINQDMKALTLSPNFCALYVYHYLLANNHNVLRATLKAGNTVESIDFAAFTTYQIPSPPLIEQVKIADAVESVAINIRKKEQAMCSYKNMKKALMQDLLTGKVRVCVNE